MSELCFDEFSVTGAAGEAVGGQLAKFLRRLPEACRRAGLDPERTKLLVHVVPERPEWHAFSRPMSMGSGAHSVRDCGLLLGRVTDALSLLSAAQQNGGMGHDFNHGFDRYARGRIEAAVRDVAMALTGRRIEFDPPAAPKPPEDGFQDATWPAGLGAAWRDPRRPPVDARRGGAYDPAEREVTDGNTV